MTSVSSDTSTIRADLLVSAHHFALLCLLSFTRLSSVDRSISDILSSLDAWEDSVADIVNHLARKVAFENALRMEAIYIYTGFKGDYYNGNFFDTFVHRKRELYTESIYAFSEK